jgi:hypothetical protein|tara:strand:+ start:401 stop:514 length:114 start_codon:yes stop_codon:yes gene_type:complete
VYVITVTKDEKPAKAGSLEVMENPAETGSGQAGNAGG